MKENTTMGMQKTWLRIYCSRDGKGKLFSQEWNCVILTTIASHNEIAEQNNTAASNTTNLIHLSVSSTTSL